MTNAHDDKKFDSYVLVIEDVVVPYDEDEEVFKVNIPDDEITYIPTSYDGAIKND